MADQEQPSSSSLLEMVQQLMPPLDSSRHKGEAGRIGIIGGSEEFTGAPYFVATTAMRAGADLSYIFCAKDAAVAIKSYSPELIVYPNLYVLSINQKFPAEDERFHKFFRYTMKYSSEPLVLSVATRWRSRTVKKKCEATMKAMFTCFWIVEPSEPRVEVWFGSMRVKDRNRTYWPKDPTFQRDSSHAEKEIDEIFEKIHVVVFGPGLGKKDSTLKTTEHLIAKARERDLPIVIDADGLWLINQKPNVIKGYQKAILTPNVMEAKRLWKALDFPEDSWEPKPQRVQQMSNALGNVTVLIKGSKDLISDGNNSLESSVEYGLKRCGGQGDVMSGALGTFFFWATQAKHNKSQNSLLQRYGPACCAAYAASVFTRRCSKYAFEELGRSMLVTDMLTKIPQVIRELEGHK